MENLSDFYTQIAKDELNETEIRKEQSIKQFNEWLSKHPFIKKCEIEPIRIIALLRAKKYNMNKVYENFSRLIITQQNLPQVLILQNYEKLLEIYDKEACLVMQNYDSNGRRVLVTKHKILEKLNVSFTDILKLHNLIYESLTDEPESQICGVVLIHDFCDISINYIKKIDLNVLEKFIPVGDIGAFRYKQINILGLSTITNSLFELVKTLLSEKMKSRLNFCKNIKDLTKVMDVKNLTVEYGGTENPEDCVKNFRKHLEETAIKSVTFFDNLKVDDNKMRIYENERISEGVGSFRKLEID